MISHLIFPIQTFLQPPFEVRQRPAGSGQHTGPAVHTIKCYVFRPPPAPVFDRRLQCITLFVPPGIESLTKVPLAILLHGVYGSHWAWALKGGAHKTALELIESRAIRPLVLAMPSDGLCGDGNGYLKHAHADYEAWIMDDVVDCVREVVRQTSGGLLFLSGLSMGGFGAMRMGARHAGKIRAISAHSSITHVDQIEKLIEEPVAAFRALSEAEQSVAHALIQAKSALPPLRFDCGTGDSLIEPNRALHRSLLDAEVRHVYEEFPGAHTWAYWREHLRETLLFFNKHA